ncbi:hypothetical protein QZH41_004952 [Actinostola sp. cb2023]|nr:hypothetical protein QZH41_004952 [Actinostola sp. cb2023]
MRWVTRDLTPLEAMEGMSAPPCDFDFIDKIAQGAQSPNIADLPFRDPNNFLAGQLHLHARDWEELVARAPYDDAYEVLDWVKNKVSVVKFFRHFRGSFQGRQFDSDIPPPTLLKNNKSCEGFTQFIDNTLLERVLNGSISVVGKVGEVNAPYLVMPLTVEPTKPRLCHDNRYLNLWMVDKPFRLDNLSHLPRYLTKDSYQSVLDDKSGYNHILLEEPSRAFFGLQWKGWYFVSNTIPFGWKLSAWIYHSTGLVATHFFRSIGIPSSVYIDDRHIGELQLGTPGTIPLSATPRDRTKLTNAQDAVYVVAYTLSHLGYTLGLPKCVLTPQKQIKFLGFISDTEQEAFYLPINKQKDFLALVASILAKRHVSVHTLQRLAGKCSSFNLAIQDARLYTNEMNMAIGKALKTSKPAHLSPALRLEIEHWASPEVVSKVGKWRHEKHSQFVIFSDASKFAWGALFPEHSLIPVSDYWSPDMSLHNIAVKETKALTNAILTFRESLVNARVDAFVDNQCLVQAWRTQAARAGPFSDALKELYSTVADQNIHLAVSYISSGENPADEPSRKLSPADCKLAPHLWSLLQEHPRFGGPSGHSIDLMALDSNTQDGKDGKPLPHFTPYPMPGSSGIDIFAQDLSSPESDPLLRNLYVFPPIILIGLVIRLLQENNCSSTIVIPDVRPRRYWWPTLNHVARTSLRLASRGQLGAIRPPSKEAPGYLIGLSTRSLPFSSLERQPRKFNYYARKFNYYARKFNYYARKFNYYARKFNYYARKFNYYARKFNCYARKFNCYARKFNCYARKFNCYARKFNYYARKFNCYARKFNYYARKFNCYARKFNCYARKFNYYARKFNCYARKFNYYARKFNYYARKFNYYARKFNYYAGKWTFMPA